MKKTKSAVPFSRIAALFILVIGVLNWFLGQRRAAIILAISGLVLLVARRDAEKQWPSLLSSFRFGKTFLSIALLDAASLFTIFLSARFLETFLKGTVGGFSAAQLSPAALASEAGMQSNIALMKGVMWKVGVGLFAFAIISVLVYALTRWIIWHLIRDKKLANARRFTLFTLAWLLIWILPLAIVLFGTKPIIGAYFAIVIGIAYFHFSSLGFLTATQLPIRAALKATFICGSGLRVFLVPYAYAISVYTIGSQLLGLLVQFVGTQTQLVIATLYVLLWLAWYRGYIASTVLLKAHRKSSRQG